MTTTELLAFMRTHRLAVEASVADDNAAQAALVGIAVTDNFEIVFDTLDSTRKARNLRRAPHLAFVLGGWLGGDERTVQYEGIADEPEGEERERIKAAYYAAWPDGPSRVSWPGLIYVRVRPTWVRYSDFMSDPPTILELSGGDLVASL